MRYMLTEHYTNGPGPVYERAARQGRMLPDGLRYIDSWIVDDDRLDTCFQLMETDDPALFDQWLSHWHDLGRFEYVPVIDSSAAAARVGVSWQGGSGAAGEPGDVGPVDVEPALVRPFDAADAEPCMVIAGGLTDFFNAGALDDVPRDLLTDRAWVVTIDGAVVGFAVVRLRFERAGEILWAAVDRDRQRRGLGRQLIGHVLDDLGTEGVAVVEVKTLDESEDYEPYIATRAFWRSMGFVRVDLIDPLPGWEPGNPAAIFICALSPTRSPR